MLQNKALDYTEKLLNSHKRMSYDTLKMCLTNDPFRDKKTLSQKLIVRNSQFREFWRPKWCVITDVFGTEAILGVGFYMFG